MSWIQSNQSLERHPKLLSTMKKLTWKKNEVIGFIHRFWWWVLAYAEDGFLNKFSNEIIAEGLDCDEAVIQVLYDENWIDEDKKVHDWLDYAGKYLESKYRTSNPKKLKSILRRYKTVSRQTKDSPKTDRLDKIDKIDKIYTIATPLQKVVCAYKLAKGFKKDDREWDKLHWKRSSKSAKQLLDVFKGNWETIVDYIYEEKEILEKQRLNWTFETLIHRCSDYKLRKEREKEENQ